MEVVRQVRGLVLALLAVTLLVSGCGIGSNDGADRNGSRGLGDSTDPGFVGGNAVTLVPPAERQPLPVISGPALSGQGTISTADYAGKVIVLNVWGSWCAPCRLEAKDLNDASKDTADIAQFIGIDVRDLQTAAPRAFVRQFGITYPHIYDPSGQQLVRFAGILPANGIPSTLVIDKQGRMAARIVGVVDRATLVTLVRDTDQGR